MNCEYSPIHWANKVRERDELIRAIFRTMHTLRMNGKPPSGRQLDHFERRMREMGMEVDV